MILGLQLEKYYHYIPSDQKLPQVKLSDRQDYSLFDTRAFQEGFVAVADDQSLEARFYISDMSCYACVWVCEQLARKIDPKAELTINMASGEASLSIPKDGHPLSTYFRSFESLGYVLTPNRLKDETSNLSRIGVAFFCLMNVMMLALPDYLDPASLEPQFRNLFRGISAVLAAVTIFYSGWPFLCHAWKSILKRTIHLDMPISLALLVGFAYSVANMIAGKANVYFDSMTAVVTLLLLGRTLQSRALARIVREQARFLEGQMQYVRIRAGSEWKMVPLPEVTRGANFSVLPGETISLRSVLLSSSGDVSYGLMRGESQSRVLTEGDEITAGAVNGSHRLDLRSLENGSESVLLTLQKASRDLQARKGHYLTLSERMAHFFVFFVLAAAFGIGLYFLPIDVDEGFERFAAVLLVACPCIFGFGTPLVMARAFQLGLQRGIIFRSQKALETLGLIDRFYFDKTGTLTEDDSKVETATWNETNLKHFGLSREEVRGVLRRLAHFSNHGTALAIQKWARESQPTREDMSLSTCSEFFGQGLSFSWKGRELRVGKSGFCFEHLLRSEHLADSYVSIDGREILRFTVGEQLRPEAQTTVRELKRLSKNVYILSGDRLERVSQIAAELDLAPERFLADLDPQDKLRQVSGRRNSAMVGNGMNDSLASSGATLGIALATASDAMKAASDICFHVPGLHPLIDAIELSRETRRVLIRCFGLALGFNVIAMSLALSGIVTPVMAAVLMPASSLSVFIASQYFRLPRRT